MYPEFEEDLRLLELNENPSIAELKSSYRTLTKVWHPDRFSHDGTLKKKADKKLAEINLGYND